MDRLENFQKALQELVEGLVKERTQDRLDALTNYVEGRLQGFMEALQNLRIQAVDLEARNSLEEHRKKVIEKLKEARDVMDVLSQGLEKHTGLIKSLAEKLAAVSDAVGVVDKKVNDFWEKYHAEMEQVNLRLETLQTSFEALRETVNSEFKALREEFSTALQELKERLHLLEQKFSEPQ